MKTEDYDEAFGIFSQGWHDAHQVVLELAVEMRATEYDRVLVGFKALEEAGWRIKPPPSKIDLKPVPAEVEEIIKTKISEILHPVARSIYRTIASGKKSIDNTWIPTARLMVHLGILERQGLLNLFWLPYETTEIGEIK